MFRLIYGDKKSFYVELLEKDESVSVHHRNIEALVTEMHEVKSGYTPKLLGDLFNQREIRPSNLRKSLE